MRRYLSFAIVVILVSLVSGCGNTSADAPPTYVGHYKSVHSNSGSDKVITVTVTVDDGVLYEGFIDTIPIKGTWGVVQTDQLGLISNELIKGEDTYFVSYYLSIAGSAISGLAYRQ